MNEKNMKTRLLTGNNQAATEMLATTKGWVRLVMMTVILAFSCLAARANGPVITVPYTISLMEDGVTNVPVGVSDDTSSYFTVTITANSSLNSLVTNATLAVGGNGTNRLLLIKPGLHQSGYAVITLIATDALKAKSTNTIDLTVVYTNYPPVFTKTIANRTQNENANSTNLSFTISDVQTPAANLTVTATSSNPTLVPDSDLTISGAGATRTLTLTEAPNENGTAIIQLIATDNAGATGTNSFTLNVLSVNQPPTFTAATNRLVYGENYGPVSLPAFLSNVTSGPDNQSGESNYFVLNYPAGFFLYPPTLDANYDLNFQVVSNQFGTNTIQFILYNTGSTTNGGKNSLTNNITLAVPFINQAPSYSMYTNLVQVMEESAGVTNIRFFSSVSVGPANQSGQTWSFTALTPTNNVGNALFAAPPKMATNVNGTLSFKPLAHSYGTNTVTLIMTTSGKTNNGGITSFTNTFQIAVVQTSHAPTITATNLTVLENSAVTTTINVWDYDQQSANLNLTAISPKTNLDTISITATNIASVSNTLYTVTFTAGTNAFGSVTNQLIATEGGTPTTNLLIVTITHVNQAPSFTLTTNWFTVVEESGVSTNKGIIAVLSVGPTNQNGQTWTYTAITGTNNATNALFATLPAVATNGTLTFKPATHSYGTNTVTLIMTSTGTTNNGGVNTATNTFQIGVSETSHAPTIAGITNLTVLENSSPVTNTLNVWDYDLQSSSLVLTAISTSTNRSTVSIVATNIASASNTLFTVVFTPLTNTFGTVTNQFIATEGGTPTTNALILTITHVNQAPSFTLATNWFFVMEESAGSTNKGIIASLSVGPTNENGQTWTYTAITGTNNATNSMFATLPAVATNGTLTFKPLAHSYGTNTVTLIMTDNGGTANGGVNVCTNTFQIGVGETSHSPTIVGATNRTTFENTPLTATLNVWDYDLLSSNLTLAANSLNTNLVTVSITATNIASLSNALFTVVFTPVTNVFGIGANVIQLIAKEGVYSTTNLMSLTITHVTQPPGFTPSTNVVQLLEESLLSTNKGVLTGINVGPTNQTGLTWTFATTTATGAATNASFAVTPTVTTNGSLICQPLAHSYGTNQITVVMTSSGSTNNGGVNTYTNSFLLGIIETNHAPVIIGANNRTALENGTPVTASITVWDYDVTSSNQMALSVTSLNTNLATANITHTNFVNASNVLYTVVFTQTTNASGTASLQLVASEFNLFGVTYTNYTTNTLNLAISLVNQPPSFAFSTNYISTNSVATNILVQALEESSMVTNTNFLTNISVGPTNQSGETWTFTATTASGNPATNATFAILPAVDTNGTLTFQPQAHSFGTNLVTVVMATSGNTANGGVNAFTNNFLIGIAQTNHAPVIAGTNSITVLESGTPVTASFNVWDYDLQSSNLTLTATSLSNNLAMGAITARTTATFSNVLFTVAFACTNISGTFPIQLVAGEAAINNPNYATTPTTNYTTNLVMLNVSFVNQPPIFTPSTNMLQVLEESPVETFSNFLTGISVGPTNQAGETWTFSISTDTSHPATNAVFAITPTVDNNGTITFKPKAHSYGTNQVIVVMTTSGGTANGGENIYFSSFNIGIMQTNHAPQIDGISDQTVFEDGTPVTATISVWDYDLQATNLTLAGTTNSQAMVTITATNIVSASNAVFTVSFAPGLNISGTIPVQLTAAEGSLSSVSNLNLNIIPVNQPPSFSPSTNLLLGVEESPMVTVTNFLTAISAGPANQSDENWAFTVNTDTNNPETNALFAVAPVVDINGSLTYQPLPHSFGTNLVTVTMTTSGSTDNGGINTYTTNFLIGIVATNHVPEIDGATDQTALENGSPVTVLINVWDYDQASSNLVLVAKSLNTNLATVSITTTNIVSSSNAYFTVVFTPGANTFGTITNQFIAWEGGFGTTNYTTNTLNLNLAFVNQPPSFTPATNVLQVLEESPIVTNLNFLTGMSVGPANQSGETYTFSVNTDTNNLFTNALFAVSPTIDNSGTLIFQPLAHSFGTNTVTVTMTTSGSTDNGGINTYVSTFIIGVITTNHAPVIISTDQSFVENDGAATNVIEVWDYDLNNTNLVLQVNPSDSNLATVSIVATNPANSYSLSSTYFSVAITPTPNAYGTLTNQLIATEGPLSTTNYQVVTIGFINQPPTNTLTTNWVQALEESGVSTTPAFIASLSVGPSNQNWETWGYYALPGTGGAANVFFATPPAVSTNGTLTFAPLTHSYGTNTITLVMTNSGGTANGGINAFTNTFQLAVIQTNHAPVIANATNLAAIENAGPVTNTISVWDYDSPSTNLLALTASPLSVSMATVSIIATNYPNASNAVFTVVCTPATNFSGTAPIQLVASETPLSSTYYINLNVGFVNQPPSFNPATNLVLVPEESATTTDPGFLKNISVGPANQSDETWTFTASTVTTNATNAVFVTLPSVSTNGTLTFAPLAHSYGTNTVTVVMTTSGLTDNGGVNSYTNSFQIGIVETNHIPAIVGATNQTTSENGAAVTATINVWDYDVQSSNLVLAASALNTNLDSVSITATNLGVGGSNAVFTVVVTPNNNAFGTNSIQLTASEGALSTTTNFTVGISFVNQPPSYTTNYSLLQVLEESGVSTTPGLLASLSVGPTNQNGQIWGFTTITATNSAADAVFYSLPSVSTNGTLTFRPQIHSYGTNTITLVMTNSGGTANGGVNAYTNTFQIGIIQTNHAPVIANATNQTTLENGTPIIAYLNVWDYDPQSSNTLSLTASSLNTNLATVSITATNEGPASNAVFTVVITPANNAFGTNNIQLVASEGPISGVQTTLTTTNNLQFGVVFVNQPPSFSLTTNLVQALEESGWVNDYGFLASLSVGPTNQSGQTWGFTAIPSTNNYSTNFTFAIPPAVTTNGTLSFTPLPHSYGTNTITLVMTNSAGTNFGGVNAYTNTFLIGIIQTNHAPTIVGATNQTVNENGTPVTTTINVWDYDLQSTNLVLTGSSNSQAVVSITATNIATASNAVFTVVFTPGTNYYGATAVQLVATEGPLSTTNSLTFNITQRNQPPSFTPATNLLLVLEESAAMTNAGFLTNISVGPTNQNGQTWSFATTTQTNNPATNASFAILPSVATNGTLIFQPLAHSYGTNLVTVVMTTSGTTTNGGVNACTNSFLIGVIQTNHAPVIAGAVNETVWENGAPATATINVWDYDLQSTNLNLTGTSNSQAVVSIIATNVASASNVLFTVTFAGTNTSGAIPVQLIATEGSLSTTNNLTLTVSFVNQPPSYTLSTNLLQALEESPIVTNASFLTNLIVGPANQNGQTWSFVTTTATNNATNAFFAVAPSVATNGTLTFQPLAHSYGTNTVTVVMYNSGLTLNGGVIAFTNSFTLGIIETNHAPSIIGAANETLAESGASVTNTINVWDYDLNSSALTLNAFSMYSNTLATVSIIATNIASVSNTLFTVVYTPVAQGVGTNPVTFVATEGLLSTTNVFDLTLALCTQPPTYTLSANVVKTLEDSGTNIYTGFIASQSVGPAVQNGETWGYTIVSSNAIFATQPSVTTNGVLTLVPLAHYYGTNMVSLIMTNSGGTANGGINAYTNTFTIDIIQTNHAPSIVGATNQATFENGAAITASLNVWDYDLYSSNLVLVATSLNTNLATVSITATNLASVSNALYTVVITPALNAFGTNAIQLVASEGGFSTTNYTTNSLNYTITFVNQPPTNTLSTNLVLVPEETGATTNAGFVASLSVGPTNQSGQTWSFTAQTDTSESTNALFAALPAVSTNGTLTFTPLAHTYGTNAVTLIMINSGGTANGGVNAFTNTFLLGIIQTNHAPVIAGATNQTLLENSNLTATINVWDYDPSASNLVLTATSLNTNLAIVSITATNIASVSNTLYTVVFTAATNVFGTTSNTIQFVASEVAYPTTNAATLYTTNLLTLTVTHVNQAPSFTLSTNVVLVAENAGLTTNAGFVASLSVGPTNQNGQTWTFAATTSTNSATNVTFAAIPAISTNGTLTFNTASYSFGTNLVTVVMTTSGGTANGGVNSATNSFQLEVAQVQYPPAFTGLTNKTILENALTNVTLPFTLFDPLTTNFNVSCSVSSNASLVAVTVTGTGRYQTLKFAPTTNSSGSSIITVTADDGALGNTNSTNFLLTVQWVNQAPSFNLAITNVNVTEYKMAVSIPAAVTNIQAGPVNQNTNGETVSFVVTNGNSSLFLYPPAVDASGTLTFTPGVLGGTVTLGIRAVNSGGTANGGVNTSLYQTMTINIPANPFAELTGPFTGLFYDTNNAGNNSSGYFDLVLANDATFTGYLLCEGNSNVFSGRFNITNNTAVINAYAYTLNLSLDTSAAWTESITGSVTNSTENWNVPLLAYLAGYSTNIPTILAGAYTMTLPGFENPADGPAGNSIFDLSVSAGGTVTWNGSLADDTAVSGTGELSSTGYYPLYAPLYDNGAGGSLIGWLSFTGNSQSSLSTNSALTWFDLSGYTGLYTGGFTNQAVAVAAVYDDTLSDLLSFSSGTVILTGGNLAAPITNSVVINNNLIIVDPAATNGLSLYMNSTNGEVMGSFITSGSVTNNIDSVILQNSTNVVNGYFLGASQGGSFILFGN
jgi:hypothetical protein